MSILRPLGAERPGDISGHGLRHVVADVFGRFRFLRAPDLADHHDRMRIGIGLEQLEDILERRAVDRIAADADTRDTRSPDPSSAPRPHSERSRTANDAHMALEIDVPGHNAEQRLARRDDDGRNGAR